MTSTGIFLIILVLVLAAIVVGMLLTKHPKGGQAGTAQVGGWAAVGGGEDPDDDSGCGCPHSIVAYMVDRQETVAD